MSGRDIERDLSDFFRDNAAPGPSMRLREAVAEDRFASAGGGIRRRRTGTSRPRQLALSVIGLAASVVLTGGLVLALANRSDRYGIAGTSETPSADQSALGPASASPSDISTVAPTDIPSESPNPSPTLTPSPTTRPSISFGPAGQFGPAGTMGDAYTLAVMLQDGRVLVTGGTAGDMTSAELFDPATGQFTRTGAMAGGHNQGSATLLPDGRVLILAGLGRAGSDNLSAEVYSPNTGGFSPAGIMPADLNNPTAVLLQNGKVLIVGTIINGTIQTAAAELYDPAAQIFTPTGAPSAERILPTATVLADGRVLVAGGFDSCCSMAPMRVLASTELYDPSTGVFTPAVSMKSARVGGAATRLADGRVLITGGSNGSVGVASAELFDPATGKFSPTGSMTTDRSYPSSTLLPDGRVLITGGFHDPGSVASADKAFIAMTGTADLASAEIYNPNTGKFIRTGSMTTQRSGPAAVLLLDGRVLIVGGSTSSEGPMATTELYQP
jgi:hypothetical protein